MNITTLTDDKLNIFLYKIIKYSINLFGNPFFKNKSLTDLTYGNPAISVEFNRYGCLSTCNNPSDNELLKLRSKYPSIKIKNCNIDTGYNFIQSDITFDLANIQHLSNLESHIKSMCSNTKTLILECAVADTNDPNYIRYIDAPDNYYRGYGCLPSAAYIERLLHTCGFTFKRYDDVKLNNNSYLYNWNVSETELINLDKRRLWVATKVVNKQFNIEYNLLPPKEIYTVPKLTFAQSVSKANSFNTIKANSSYNKIACCVYGDFTNINQSLLNNKYDYFVYTPNKDLNRNINYWFFNAPVSNLEIPEDDKILYKLKIYNELVTMKTKMEILKNSIYEKVIIADISELLNKKYTLESMPSCVSEDFIYGNSFEMDMFANVINKYSDYSEETKFNMKSIFNTYMESLNFTIIK